MTYFTYLISSPETMETVGATLALTCGSGCVLHLIGDLGAGKTTLVRGFIHALGHPGLVKSPTYTLVEPYLLNNRRIYHFDFYRLGHPEELEYLGIRDYLEDNVICLIEWPERGSYFTPPADILVRILPHNEGRVLELEGVSTIGLKIIYDSRPRFDNFFKVVKSLNQTKI